MNEPFNSPSTSRLAPSAYAAPISFPISATRRAITASSNTTRLRAWPPVRGFVPAGTPPSGVAATLASRGSGITNPEMEGRAPRLGFRSGGARDAGDPHDSAAGVRQHGRHRALASADPPFNEKLLELLRPVGEPDAVARAPPPELEREAERRGIERRRRRCRFLVHQCPLDGEPASADDRHAFSALRSCDDERPVHGGRFRPPRARPYPNTVEFPLQAHAADHIEVTAARAKSNKLKRCPGSRPIGMASEAMQNAAEQPGTDLRMIRKEPLSGKQNTLGIDRCDLTFHVIQERLPRTLRSTRLVCQTDERHDGAGRDALEARQHLVAQAVASVTQGVIGGVLAVAQPHRPRVRLQLRPAEREQRANDAAPPLRDPGEAAQAGA